ncbi:MAG: hydrolase TatD [Candidatus Magasanikbacteria bacterium CG10_big_fil_rev_8_21_14_0_10_43_6]|uniref:Hydrolase TatD n=1 Tax=Candidatus Magasanikbacteria bacterium CG10_big_fil_rev_8_21_14_0_10_43_6 TaxID=1974650 RepID=A0A2M6W2C0_9BACT|nr:MAG: hydrolase TatD [Candidatus Magasanikbacteria bacterium CG10_big_fil_rev_8_21_14_0_10_43_6]
MFDTHCHIQFKAFQDDLDQVILRCTEKNTFMNVVGTQIPTSKKAIALAEKYDNVYASVGIHPIQHDVVDVEEETTHFTSRGEEWDQQLFETLVQHPKVIGVGETGLDRFHIRKDVGIEDIFAKQKELFLQHYHLAKKFDKALVIHVRDAHTEMIEILEELGAPIRGTIHCFTGNWDQAERYLALGLHLGFTGVITFPPKKTDPQPQLDLWEVVKKMPLDRMLVETDAPYLAAQAYRGERSEPWMVEECIKKIAEIRTISLDTVQKSTTKNARTLFLPLSR